MELLQKALLGIIIVEVVISVPVFGYAAYQYAECKRTEEQYDLSKKRAEEELRKFKKI